MKFCTNCGNQMPVEQKFCTRCGSPQKVVEATSAPVEPTPIPEPAPEPEATPEPIPEPAPLKQSPEYANVLQLVLALGKVGVLVDVIDEPAELGGPAKSAWSLNQLAAVTHQAGGAEYRIVLADGNLDPSSYANLMTNPASARYGNWIVAVDHVSGGANESARVLERVFELLG